MVDRRILLGAHILELVVEAVGHADFAQGFNVDHRRHEGIARRPAGLLGDNGAAVVDDHRTSAEEIDNAAVLLDIRAEVGGNDIDLIEHGVGTVLQLPHAGHHGRLDQRGAEDYLGTVHGEAADDFRIDAFMADTDAYIADFRAGHGIDRLHRIAVTLLLHPLVPIVVRVRVAEHAAFISVARRLVALVDDFTLRADDEGDVEISVRKIRILHHVEFGGDVGVDFLGLAAQLVGLGTGNLDGELPLGFAVARPVRDHALNRHFRNNNQLHRRAFPGTDHASSVHEIADAFHVLQSVFTLLDGESPGRQGDNGKRFDHRTSPQALLQCILLALTFCICQLKF